jgi:ferredoxin-type protein NapH
VIEMEEPRLQKFRKTILYLWIVIMPIIFNWMSPVLIIFASFSGVFNLSFLFFSIWFISSLFLGRWYCAYLCPWGAMQEIYGNLINKSLDPKKKSLNRKVKYWIFAIWFGIIIAALIITNGFVVGFDFYFPNEDQTLVSFDGTVSGNWIFYFGIQLFLAVIFTAFAGNRGFCSYGCPMAVFGVIGSKIKNALHYPSLHLEINPEKCSKCGICSKSCPMSLDVKNMVETKKMVHNDCILCGSCIGHCPNQVIKYAWKWK